MAKCTPNKKSISAKRGNGGGKASAKAVKKGLGVNKPKAVKLAKVKF